MELKRIKYFVTLAEQLHFGRAADQLYISQSALSYHISELENELGVPLFMRSKRKVLLTSAGSELLPAAKELLEKAERLERMAGAAKHTEPDPRTLRICFDASFERFDLLGIPKALSELRGAYPELKISFSLLALSDLLSGVETLAYDIGFGILRNDEKAGDMLNTLPLYEDYLSLVHNREELDGCELRAIFSRQPLYLTEGDDRWTDYIRNYLTGRDIEHTLTLMDNFSDILTHVYLGEGITILPDTQCRAEAMTRPGLRSLPLNDPACLLRTCAFWAKGNYNYAITLLLAGIQISPEVSSLFG